MKKVDHLSQIVLYAKGWFKKGDMFEDLRILISEAYDLYIEHISDEDVRQCLYDTCIALGVFDNEHNLREFVTEISPQSFYKYAKEWSIKHMGKQHPDYDFNRAVICKCLSYLSLLKVNDKGKPQFIFKRPNYDLLPPYKNDTDIRINQHEWDEDDE